VGGREGMRQAAQPLPENSVDLVGGKHVGNLLDPSRRGGGSDAVVQWLEGNLALGELPLEPFVTVETELGRVRKVGAELDEDRSEVSGRGCRRSSD
jgi:hypothetical protein